MHVQFGGGKSEKWSSNRATRWLPILHEAILTVLCHGNTEPMALIHQRLEIGEQMGEVPEDSPAVPLQRDLENKQRRLRLKPSTPLQNLDPDLRKHNHHP